MMTDQTGVKKKDKKKTEHKVVGVPKDQKKKALDYAVSACEYNLQLSDSAIIERRVLPPGSERRDRFEEWRVLRDDNRKQNARLLFVALFTFKHEPSVKLLMNPT